VYERQSSRPLSSVERQSGARRIEYGRRLVTIGSEAPAHAQPVRAGTQGAESTSTLSETVQNKGAPATIAINRADPAIGDATFARR
jgi:hypothetical protein